MLVVIGSSPERAEWLAGASESIGVEHIAVVNEGYELAKIGWALNNTRADRFLFLQDSFVVKDQGFFELLDAFTGSVALFDDPAPYGCFAGVFERSALERVGIPAVASKRDSVRLEVDWCRDYVEAAGHVPILFPDLRDNTGVMQIHNGRNNLVLENEFIKKFKGTWKVSQLDTLEVEENDT